MSKQTANDITKAINRRSLVIADNLALDLTRKDLEFIYQAVGLSWLAEQLAPGLTVGDVMSRYHFEDVGSLDSSKHQPGLREMLLNGMRNAAETLKEYANE